jgi:hypothetical protein
MINVSTIFDASVNALRKRCSVEPHMEQYGTTILASERTGRLARLIELDPLYVDVAIRRWQEATSVPARHSESGPTFNELEETRANPTSDENDDEDES